MEYRIGTGGGEKLDEQADIESIKSAELFLTNLASRVLVEKWRSGSQDAARVLMARYEVRLIALIASRLNRRLRNGIDPQDVVQSAMGSFFRVTRADAKPTIQLESTASAWNILATFARRKLSRALERETASKRGGGWSRTPLDQVEPAEFIQRQPSASEAEEFLEELNSLLSSDQALLLQLLLQNASQREIADRLEIDERTVRRRIAAIRTVVAGHLASDDDHREADGEHPKYNIELPNISYKQFVLGKMIGSGGLGKVYRARMQLDGSVVAVKFMHRHLWADSGSKLSFLREIDHASRINHPGIVKYRGWGESPHGGPYIVSELVDGLALAKVNRDNADCAVQWLVQICEAVECAHQAGIVHGDLTPNNILLSNDGRVVITDFGFAISLNGQNESCSRGQEMVPLGGTLGFAAPEQISSAFGRIGRATDIYAIGGLAYYLLTGRGPHDRLADSLSDTISDEDVPVANAPRTNAGAKLARVANLALKKAITRRPKSARELADLLSD